MKKKNPLYNGEFYSHVRHSDGHAYCRLRYNVNELTPVGFIPLHLVQKWSPRNNVIVVDPFYTRCLSVPWRFEPHNVASSITLCKLTWNTLYIVHNDNSSHFSCEKDVRAFQNVQNHDFYANMLCFGPMNLYVKFYTFFIHCLLYNL